MKNCDNPKNHTGDDKSMPNKPLYLFLFGASILICLLSLFIRSSVPVFTIMSGVGCGGATSTLVAYLIERANWKASLLKLEKDRSIILNDFLIAFDTGCDGVKWLCYSENSETDPSAKKTWLEWFETAYAHLNGNTLFMRQFSSAHNVFFDNLNTKANVLKSQESVLLERGVISADDAKALSYIITLYTYVDNRRFFMKQVVSNEELGIMIGNCRILYNILEKSEVLQTVNTMKTGDPFFRKISETGVDIERLF